MRSRLFSSAPSLRIELSSRCSLKRYLRHLLLVPTVLLRYTYTLLNRTPARWY